MHLIRWSLLVFPAYYPHSLIVAQANYPSASLGPQNYHLFPDPLHPDFSLPFLLSLNSMINHYTHSLMKWSKVKSLSSVRLFVTPWTGAYQAPPSMGCSRQEYWSRLPFPSPGDLPNSGIEPWSPALQADALTSELPGKPFLLSYHDYPCLVIAQRPIPWLYPCTWRQPGKRPTLRLHSHRHTHTLMPPVPVFTLNVSHQISSGPLRAVWQSFIFSIISYIPRIIYCLILLDNFHIFFSLLKS